MSRSPNQSCGFSTFNNARKCLKALINTLHDDDLNQSLSRVNYRAMTSHHGQYYSYTRLRIYGLIGKGLKRRKEFKKNSASIRYLAQKISYFVCTSSFIYFDCIGIGCKQKIKVDHKSKVMFYGDQLLDGTHSEEEIDIEVYHEPQIIFRYKSETNIIAFFFGVLPSDSGVPWLGIAGEGNVGILNAMNYNRMRKFRQILQNYDILPNHLDSQSGPCCSTKCFASRVFGDPKQSFGPKIDGKLVVQEYIKYVVIEEIPHIPSIPIVIMAVIGAYIHVP